MVQNIANTLFIFWSIQFYFLKFQYNGHLGDKVSTTNGHDHLVKMSGGIFLFVKLYGILLLYVVTLWPDKTSWGILFIIVFASSPAYHPLPQISMFWAKILDQPVHFSTIVEIGPHIRPKLKINLTSYLSPSPQNIHKIRAPIPLAYAGLYTVYSWIILTAIL
jgi:hypothetical protein